VLVRSSVSYNPILADDTRYSDVTHEVTEVTDGYRWVLTYNLVRKQQGEKPSAAKVQSDLGKLRSAFESWQSDDELFGQEHFIHILNHQYTDSSLRLNALKPEDLVAARALQEVSNDTDCTLFLASCEREVFGGCDDDYNFDDEYGYDEEDEDVEEEDSDDDDDGVKDENETEYHLEAESRCKNRQSTGIYHSIIDVCDEKLLLKHVVDLNGVRVAHDLSIDENNFLEDFPFEDRDPDDEDYSGFTGNEGVSATHWYRDSVSSCINTVQHLLDFQLNLPGHHRCTQRSCSRVSDETLPQARA
jgi:hypothetical protein